MNTCIDCGKEVYWTSIRCAPCRYAFARGENASNYRGGFPKCLDCGKELTNYSVKRCKECQVKHFTGINHPNYGVRIFGEKSPHWQGGRDDLSKQIRKTLEYRMWRSDVFTRDDFTCQECGDRGCNLHAHHKKPFSLIVLENNIITLEDAFGCDELWNLNNGITWCKECHFDFHFNKEASDAKSAVGNTVV